MKKTLLLSLLCLASLLVQAQPDPIKWGKVSSQELKMTEYERAPESDAVVLCDYGVIDFEPYYFNFNRHTRIKLLKKSSFNYANVVIPFYDYRSNSRLEEFKAHTINIGPDGKVEKIEVKKEDIYVETVFGKYKLLKFSFPQIKEGSIIEYSYQTLTGDFANMETWYFQREIPVMHSEFRTRIPSFLTYFNQVNAITEFHTQESETYYRTFNNSSGFLKITGEKSRFVLKDVPAFVEEPYLSSAKNYLKCIKFQLRNIKRAELVDLQYKSTWEELSKDLIEKNEWFGWQLEINRGLKEIAETQTAGLTDPQEKMIRIYDYVRKNVSWSGRHTIFTDKYVNKVLDEGKGSSAEINLLLTVLLKHAGVSAQPMLASTKEHGMVQTFYPMLRQFNTVLSYVEIDSMYYILNATDKHRPYFLLDDEDLNQLGFVVDKYMPEWVQIHAYPNSRQTTMANLTLTQSGLVKGSVSVSGEGYFGLKHRSELTRNGQDTYINEFLSKNIPGIQVANLVVKNKAEVESPFTVNYELQSTNFSIQASDEILIEPMLVYGLDKNPFRLEKRDYPVNYGYQTEETFILNLTLPEGYVLADAPAAVNMFLPGRAAQYMYACQPVTNGVQLISRLRINKTEFTPEEYAGLRNFYSEMINKQAEKIVLKKK